MDNFNKNNFDILQDSDEEDNESDNSDKDNQEFISFRYLYTS